MPVLIVGAGPAGVATALLLARNGIDVTLVSWGASIKETLEAASKMDGPIFLNRELDLWFIFDRLRGNPRFEALLED